MDSLSGVASVIAVIQIAQSVASGLKDYYEDVRGARDDIRRLYNSTKGLESILSNIQDILNRGDGALAKSKKSYESPLRQSELDLTKLRYDLQSSQKKRENFGKAAQLIWPFEKKDVEKTVTALERNKGALMLGLGVENLDLSSRQFDIVTDLMSETRAAREQSDRLKMMNWLSCPDPSKEYTLARDTHEEGTGQWLVEGDAFVKWANSPNSFLWLYGGAGAGKTILCSTAIHSLQQWHKNCPGCAVIYWYFTFADEQKQSLSNCILSLLGDTYSNLRKTPPGLQEAYDMCNGGRQKPDTKLALELLKNALAGLDHVFICLDALDECPKSKGERERLLDVIREICSWGLRSIHILATSRKEGDIKQSFDSLAEEFAAQDPGWFSAVGVQGLQVKDDIIKFIHRRINDRVFKTWTPKLKDEVKVILSSQADGMFRLVALQLDVLSKQNSVKEIRTAMNCLPMTLDKFYDKMFLQIDDDGHPERAHIALQWIAFAVRPITLKELAEAIIVNVDSDPAVDEEERLLDCRSLLESLPAGLVSTVVTEVFSGNVKSPEIFIQFAHFSVKEYLLSARISNGRAHDYQVQEIPTHKLMVKTCFAYLLWTGSKRPPIANDLFSDFPLLDYSARCWIRHLRALNDKIDDNGLQKLILSFMAVGTYAWRLWECVGYLETGRYDHSAEEILEGTARRPATIDHYFTSGEERPMMIGPCRIGKGMHPVTLASMFSMNALSRLLLSQMRWVDETSITTFYRNTLVEASKWGSLQALQVLVSAGAPASDPGRDYLPALLTAASWGSCEKVGFLLEQGADVNALGPRGAALHAAIMGDSQSHSYPDSQRPALLARSKLVVELLLKSGADVNVQGPVHGTPLMAAVANEFPDGVRLLLQAGARINDVNPRNQTALYLAITYVSEQIIEILLQWGADPNPQGLSGEKYFEELWGTDEYHLWNLEIFKMLLNAGVKCTTEDVRGIHRKLTEERRQFESRDSLDDYEGEDLQEFLETLMQ